MEVQVVEQGEKGEKKAKMAKGSSLGPKKA